PAEHLSGTPPSEGRARTVVGLVEGKHLERASRAQPVGEHQQAGKEVLECGSHRQRAALSESDRELLSSGVEEVVEVRKRIVTVLSQPCRVQSAILGGIEAQRDGSAVVR